MKTCQYIKTEQTHPIPHLSFVICNFKKCAFSPKGAIFTENLINQVILSRNSKNHKNAQNFQRKRAKWFLFVLNFFYSLNEKVMPMTTRPTEVDEYRIIVETMGNGFVTESGAAFRPKKQIALALQLQASLGLRIGDVLSLRVNSFKNGKLETVEIKTGKLQYREINQAVTDLVKDYAIENALSPTDRLFKEKVRDVQTQLKLVVDHLGLSNISTHSFRKMFATTVYNDNDRDIRLVQQILNHNSVATTERYIPIYQSQIDRACANINFVV